MAICRAITWEYVVQLPEVTYGVSSVTQALYFVADGSLEARLPAKDQAPKKLKLQVDAVGTRSLTRSNA